MRLFGTIASLMLAILIVGAPTKSSAGLFVSVTVEPPVLPVYEQPPIPGPDYIWTPGYWAYDEDDADYYWVPGAWVLAPEPGYLWTPGYWGWGDGVYVWHDGYWGPHVGFYGGVNYGFGYAGVGFEGGYWAGGVFTYNRSCTNFGGNTTIIQNTYNKTVIVNNTTNISFNGGNGGLKAQPTAQERSFAQEKHIQSTKLQLENQHAAGQDKSFHFKNNGGAPKVAAVSHAGKFTGAGVVGAKSGGAFKPTSLPKKQDTFGGKSFSNKSNTFSAHGKNTFDRRGAGLDRGPRNTFSPDKHMQKFGGPGDGRRSKGFASFNGHPPSRGMQGRPGGGRGFPGGGRGPQFGGGGRGPVMGKKPPQKNDNKHF